MAGQLVTLLYGVLDLDSGELRFVSAGHPGPSHLPHGSAAVSLAAHGIRPLVAPAAAGKPIDDALRAWLEGRLDTSDERVCLCGH